MSEICIKNCHARAIIGNTDYYTAQTIRQCVEL